jgi:gliding motility-associated-like protein
LLDAGQASAYTWSTGAQTSQLLVNASGQYWVKTSNGNCDAKDTISIVIHQFPSIPWINDTTLCEGETLLLDAGIADHYNWSTGATAKTIQVSTPGTYTVNNTYFQSCQKLYAVKVDVTDCDCRLYMPSAFSPNHDGLNDVFKPARKSGCMFKTFSVYDRWGMKVFSTSNIDQGWNGRYRGKDMASGVFVWIVEGEKEGRKKIFKGTVVLVR